MEIKPIT